ncbi:unnamed protein product [Amoebophrya sp. A25]|nr:unnamed protein product [Amoebophrya sp. A25]|eukprot:GSA25T00009503001.1
MMSSSCVVKETLSGKEFPARSVAEDGSVLDCIGAGCRHKKLGFIELRIYALACYVRRNDLVAECGPFSSQRDEWAPCLRQAVLNATNPLFLQMELHFMKPIPASMMSNSLREDLGQHIEDPAELSKVEKLAPPDGIASGTILRICVRGNTIEAFKDKDPLPVVKSRAVVGALLHVWFVSQDFVRGFRDSLNKEVKVAVERCRTATTGNVDSSCRAVGNRRSTLASPIMDSMDAGSSGRASMAKSPRKLQGRSSSMRESPPSTSRGTTETRRRPSCSSSSTSKAASASSSSKEPSKRQSHSQQDEEPSPPTPSSMKAKTKTSEDILTSTTASAESGRRLSSSSSLSTSSRPSTASSKPPRWIELPEINWHHVQSLRQVKMEGELYKWHLDGSKLRGKLMRNWSPRFFRLEEGFLSYRKMGRMTQPFNLQRTRVVIEPAWSSSTRAQANGAEDTGTIYYIFQILDQETQQPLFRLSARNRELAKMWVTQIVAAIFFLRREAHSVERGLRLSSLVTSSDKQQSGSAASAEASCAPTPGASSAISDRSDADGHSRIDSKVDLLEQLESSCCDGSKNEGEGEGEEIISGGITSTSTSSSSASGTRGRTSTRTSNSEVTKTSAVVKNSVDWFAVSVALLAVLLTNSLCGVDLLLLVLTTARASLPF